MESLTLLLICLVAGVLLQRSRSFPPTAPTTLNQFVLYVPLPALALYHIPEIEVGYELLFPVGVAWISFGLAWAVFATLGKALGWSNKLVGCLILTAGLGNTSFVGFPVVEALFGKQGLSTALLVDQPGSFVVLSTLGIVVANVYAGERPSAGSMARKILLFPPFIAFILAVLLNAFDMHLHKVVRGALLRLGSTVTPIALIAVGLQLRFDRRSKHLGFLGLGLFFKLMVVPAVLYLLYIHVLNGSGPVVRISLIEAAMAPMITGAVLASSYGLKPRLANMMVGVGVPLSLLTLLLWNYVLQGV
ncbi:MAG: AEC family transporter [Flavobacteriales bacterium]|nr:AEC family transporter [Flavobacteriales bacterium]